MGRPFANLPAACVLIFAAPALAGEIDVRSAIDSVIVYPDATINIARLATPGASPEPAPGAKPAPAAGRGTPSEALPVSIGRIQLTDGEVQYADYFVQPN